MYLFFVGDLTKLSVNDTFYDSVRPVLQFEEVPIFSVSKLKINVSKVKNNIIFDT